MSNMFSTAVSKDKRVRRLKKMLDHGAYASDADVRIKELMTAHATKDVRSLSYAGVVKHHQKKLSNAVFDNQIKRSRAAEIQMEALNVSLTLDNHLNRLVKYLKIKYKSQLITSGFKTISSHDDAVKNELDDAYTHLRSLERVIKICDVFIRDCDAAYNTISLGNKVFETSTRPERNI